jgi:hypothetical protein
MSRPETIELGVNGGTPGADSSDYVLLDTTLAFGKGQIRVLGINRITFSVNNSQAGTRKAYFSKDGGTTWNLFDSTAVTAASAGAMSGPFDYLVDTYRDFKLVWTNGGSAQTTWIPTLVAIVGDRASGT